MIAQTFTSARLVRSSCKERVVSPEVMFDEKMPMIMRPNRIQVTAKIRAMIDFGALSPYLKQKKTGVNPLC